MTRHLFLHIGASKTGTSSLQAGVASSREALEAVGVGVPFARRSVKVEKFLRPLGWESVEGFPYPVDGEALDGAVQRIRRTEGQRLLLTNEDLAELDEARIGELTGRIGQDRELECHVIITARDWAKQLPSEYQQQLKRRMTTDYETYLGQVRDREGEDARQFHLRQDFARMARRWATVLPAERIHVIPVDSRDRDAIFREFGAVVGYPHESVQRPTRMVNQSFGMVEAEVLRRFNVSLGKRLDDIRNEYNPGVRHVLRKRVLSREGAVRLTLPPAHLEWVQEESRRQVRDLLELGVDVRGDLELLVPTAESVAALPPLDEAEVSRVAVETFANFAVQSFRDNRRKLKRRNRAARAAAQVSGSRPGAARTSSGPPGGRSPR